MEGPMAVLIIVGICILAFIGGVERVADGNARSKCERKHEVEVCVMKAVPMVYKDAE